MKKIAWLILPACVFFGCNQTNQVTNIQIDESDIGMVLTNMTDIMINDVTNPPLAARFFAYACLSGYEVVAQNDTSLPRLYGRLNNYPKMEKPEGITGYAYQLSAVLAMIETAKKMQPSGFQLEKYEQQYIDSVKRTGVSQDVIDKSLQYAKAISNSILEYAKADRYNRISNYTRYTPTDTPGCWYPTPPGYFAPVEPFFNTIRPFTLDTSNQFRPAPPASFSTNKKSAFYTMMYQCYQERLQANKSHIEIASFWDCNPFALDNKGHLMVASKKISPGAHWMGIAGIACKEAKVPFGKAMKINTIVAIGLMDGFLACWDEKFRSNRIRPESAIRKYIDPEWQPLLQTPPFPEYLSGHSVISSASATILTHYFGENFKYADNVEERFGLPVRTFNSFQEAAIEAGISRLYGGIHFTDAIDNGRKQGLQVGAWVLKKVEGI
ncbi:MAG: vanadium-dependent haloperoxidase [Ginsengibacter sp.]